MIRRKVLETSRLLREPEQLREPPALRFSPTAWAKLLYLRDLGETEVGGFGISAADDLLCIEDVELVRQVCTGVSVASTTRRWPTSSTGKWTWAAGPSNSVVLGSTPIRATSPSRA